MSEKIPVQNVEFGVPPVTTLVARAHAMVVDDMETYQVPESAQLDWLYANYREQIYPDFYNAWRFTLSNLLADADIRDLVTGEVEHWYKGYIPPNKDDNQSNAWQAGIMRVRAELPLYNTNPIITMAMGQLALLKEVHDRDLLVDEADARQRAVESFIDAGAQLKIELFEYADFMPDGPERQYLTPDGVIQRRELVSRYPRPRSFSNEPYTVNIDGTLRAANQHEFLTLSCNSWASAQILGEYGLVLAGGSQRLDAVTELSSDISSNSPEAS